MRYIEKYIEGYDLDEESFAMDLIEEIDPGGHFLNKKHTLTNSKDFIRPELYFRDSYDNWTDQGSKDAFESARDRVDDMLDSYERPPIDSDVERDIETYVEDERAAIVE
ncbi:trimethylamine methyltransferase family protein [Haloarculaceae archaeon H-GB11]|nr:trimethylamine methyltransferase family protein [Haloarculaceae archaeon H-GB11]